ncbi:AAA family ATPase, partial [Patescibacteria group bacterium]|nr:AAA family ATPase [Patescibacteria group bacterium]
MVQRNHLLEILDQGRQLPLTLVCAPAGYGKSTLLSNWLETCDAPNCWLSLDEADNDLRQFLSYLVAAVQDVFPDSLNKTAPLAKAASLPPNSVIATSLINEIDQIDQAFIMVLDDFHLINDELSLDLLLQILAHPPQ